MRSIVVPVNFTNNSAAAARYAADLAVAIKADIHLIYVFQPPVSAAEIPLPESVYEEMRDSGLDLLRELSGQIVKHTGGVIKVYTDMEIGAVGPRLAAFCQFRNPFMVVMGTSGNGLRNKMEGSHTVQAMRNLRYPVLVVPPTAQWHPVHKIMAACDKEDIDSGLPATLPFLKELSGLLNASLEVVHVPTNGADSAAKVQNGIADYLENHQADWLMVFPKSHTILDFHKSRAKQIVLNCAIPVMSVHE